MPLTAIARSEIEQAAYRNGFPADPIEQGAWLLLRSPFTRHQLLATWDGARFLVATASEAIAEEAERDWPVADAMPAARAAPLSRRRRASCTAWCRGSTGSPFRFRPS